MKKIPTQLASLEGIFLTFQSKLSSNSPYEALAIIAGLIYLRWFDNQEAELEAISIFDGEDYEPTLPAELQWRNFDFTKGRDLRLALCGHIPRELLDKSKKDGSTGHRDLGVLYAAVNLMEQLFPWSDDEVAFLLELINLLDLETPTDRRKLLQSLDSLIKKQVSERKVSDFSGEPLWISDLVAELSYPGEQISSYDLPIEIFDPCFGSASFLVAIYEKFIREGVLTDTFEPPLSVSGFEISNYAFVIGLTRLSLAGVRNVLPMLGDGLEGLGFKKRYDVVVLNPPWGSRIEIEDADSFPVPTDDSSLLFFQQALNHLKPAGKAVIVIPQGLLFRDGAPKDFRKWLLLNFSVDAVISIPAGAYKPYTGIATAILVVSQRDPTHVTTSLEIDTVRMLDTENMIGRYHDSAGGLSSDQCRQIAKIVAMDWRTFRNSQAHPQPDGLVVQNHAWDVTLKELEDVEWDLTPRRRIKSALNDILETFSSDIDVVPLGDLCDISPGSYVNSSDLHHWYFRQYESKFQSTGKPAEGDSKTSKIAELEQARHFAAVDLSLPESGLIPYVDRFGITYGEVSPRYWLLTEDGLAYFRRKKIDPPIGSENGIRPPSFVAKRVLKGGDLLLSRSAGDVGRVAVVGKVLEPSRPRDALEATLGVGGIASRDYWVLRITRDAIDPDYLSAYLQSKECQIRLKNLAIAPSRNHLKRGALDELLIPVPSRSVQRRAIEAYELANEDVLAYLSDRVLGSKSDPIVDWMNGALEALPEQFNIYDLLGPRILGEAMDEAITVVNHSDEDHPRDLTHWFLSLKLLVANPLRECAGIPVGLALYSLTKDIEQELEGLETLLVGSSPSTSKARAIMKILTGFMKNRLNGMLDDVEVGITARPRFHPDVVDVTLVELEIHNRGLLPLRNFKIVAAVEGDSGAGAASNEVGYIEADGVVTTDLSFTTSISEGWTMEVDFSALRMDGSEFLGKSQHALKRFEMTDETKEKSPTIGSSPYITGDPVFPKNKEVFYGRDELLTKIKRQIVSGNVVLLEGNRRTGKSSILHHLKGDQAVEGWLGVYTSLQGAGKLSSVDLFRYLAREIASHIHELGMEVMMPNGQVLGVDDRLSILPKACRAGISEEGPFSDFREFFEEAVQILSVRKSNLLLMLDEFDKLQEGIDEGIISKEVPENIRFLIQNFPGVSAVLAGSRRLKQQQEEYWSALYGLGKSFLVSYLGVDAARKLIVEPVKGELVFAEAAINRAIYWTSCQPYLLQNLCHEIHETAAQSEIFSITTDFVDQSAKQLVRHNPHFAQSFKNWVESDLGRYLLVLCHEYSDGDDPFSLGVIENRLATDGLDLDSDSLVTEIESLRELEVLDFESGVYKLAVPLLGLWISEAMDTAVVLNAAKNSHWYRDD